MATAEVHAVAKRMNARLERLCAKHGLRDEPGEEASVLAVCMDAAAQDVSLFGERAGERTKKLVQAVRAAEGRLASPFVAEVGGVNIHAGVAVRGRDRSRSPGFGATLPLCDASTDRPREAHGARRRMCGVCVS